MNPAVSICMPHLNSRPFTEERMETILRQTFGNWELIVVDSQSSDGSLEMLERYARRDARIRVEQAPRDGIYPNLNRALKLCAGQFVYVATSDDTMAPDCLEKMAEALEQNRDCGLVHCCLEIIDEQGRPAGRGRSWDNYTVQQYFGEWIHKHHVRRAPHDGLLHFGFFTAYTSITQLLVRRSVYQERGDFRTDCGSYADFEWGMRIGLQENVVHLPEKLATWRLHPKQATQNEMLLRARARGEFRRLTRTALESLSQSNLELASALRKSPLSHYYLVDELKARSRMSTSAAGQFTALVTFVGRHPLFAIEWLKSKIAREKITGDFAEAVRQACETLGMKDMLREVEKPESVSGARFADTPAL
jgi:glycosyltransferase involved in cell wall biosynthesis